MLWVYDHYIILSVRVGIYTSGSDVFTPQILTYKDSPRAENGLLGEASINVIA